MEKKLHFLKQNAGCQARLLLFGIALFIVASLQAQITSPDFIGHTGFWPNVTDNPNLESAFDGDFGTNPDASEQWGFVGLYIDAGATISKVQFAPRSGFEGRMNNAIIRGSNSTNFLNDADDLFTITTTPTAGVLTEATITPAGPYKYVYILLPAYSWGNMTELKFFDDTDTELVPGAGITIIGFKDGDGTYNTNNGAQTVFDNDFNTYYECAWEGWDNFNNKCGWVGYDYGPSGATISSVMYAPRNGWAGRMENAEIRGSNSPDYLINYDVLYTITTVPNEGELTEAVINAATPYRYVYLAVAGGNVSELQFYGTVLSTNDLSVDNSFSLYPNPSNNGAFNIKLNQQNIGSTTNVKVYDITGKLIVNKDFGKNSGTIEVNQNLNSGLYIVRINNAVSAKLVVK